MKKPLFSLFCHAAGMAMRNLRSYALLSVTILLSFSLLLGFLVWTDSSLYNQNKELFHRDRSLVGTDDPALQSPALTRALREKAADLGETHSLQFDCAYFGSVSAEGSRIRLQTGQALEPIAVNALSVPPHAWCLYTPGLREAAVTWLDGREHRDFHLNSGEILLDERLYAIFGLAEKENRFSLRLGLYYDAEGRLVTRPFGGSFTVVGLLAGDRPLTLEPSAEDGNRVRLVSDAAPCIAFSSADVNPAALPGLDWQRPTVVFYSSVPQQVDALLRSVGITANIYAVYADQDRATQTIRAALDTKATITAALLVLLGINLWSSFSNALNARRFEIGVRRALGASRWSIVRQFLYESLLVMAANILLSVWLVLTVLLGCKWALQRAAARAGAEPAARVFTLTLSPASAALFALCALTLTTVFSVIFAYSAVQVQIAEHLKSE